MRLLLDINVVLDVPLERAPHAEPAARLWSAIERGKAVGLVPAHDFTTVFYIAERAQGGAFATRVVERLLGLFTVAPVTGDVLEGALELGWSDFEDAVCALAAQDADCDVIVSRDPAGFAGAPLPVLDPIGALALVERR
jgi:predicted nucleic acid-binding protein